MAYSHALSNPKPPVKECLCKRDSPQKWLNQVMFYMKERKKENTLLSEAKKKFSATRKEIKEKIT